MAPEDEKTLTIARRTKKNLDFIYKMKSQGANVEEFTQLLNSTFGILICLREDFIKSDHVEWEAIGKLNFIKDIEQFKKLTGLPPTSECTKLQSISTFSGLITNLRNAFAHNCFDLIIDEKTNAIIGVTVWNISSGCKNTKENRTWQEDFSEEQLKNVLNLVLNYVETVLDV